MPFQTPALNTNCRELFSRFVDFHSTEKKIGWGQDWEHETINKEGKYTHMRETYFKGHRKDSSENDWNKSK